MANIFAPFGFRPVRRNDGAAWTGNMTQYKIASGNSHSFFYGDPVYRLSTGYIDDSTSLPTQGVLGIFVGCEFQNVAQGSPWSNYYPGASTADVLAWVIDDPNVVFQVQVGNSTLGPGAGGPIAQSGVGGNISYGLGSGNTQNGISGAYLDANTGPTTTDTLPFTIVNYVNAGFYATGLPAINGWDPTTAGNIVEVVMNQSAYKVGTTSPV